MTNTPLARRRTNGDQPTDSGPAVCRPGVHCVTGSPTCPCQAINAGANIETPGEGITLP